MSAKTAPKDKVAAKTATKTPAKKTAPKAEKPPALPKAEKPAKAPAIPKAKNQAPPLPPVAPPIPNKSPALPKAEKAPKAPALPKGPKGMTAPEPVQRSRADFGTLEGDKEANGIWFPRVGTKHREMWDLIAKVKGKSSDFPERFKVMDAMHEANETRSDKFAMQSMSLQYHFCRTFYGIEGDREKSYKKRGANAVVREPKAPKVPKAPKAEKPPASPKAPKAPPLPVAPKAAKAPKVPKLPVAPPLPAAPAIPGELALV